MKRLMNEIAARRAAKNLEELEKARLADQRASNLNELAKQFETWMAPLIESGELVIQDRFLFRRGYVLHLPDEDLNIELVAHSVLDEIFMEFFFFCTKRRSLTLLRLGSFKPTPVFGVGGAGDPSIAERLAKSGEMVEFTQEVLEDYLLAVIDKKNRTRVEMGAGR